MVYPVRGYDVIFWRLSRWWGPTQRGTRRAYSQASPDLVPEHRERIGATLADPDQVRRSPRFGAAKLFSRWFSDEKGGKHVIVVVVSPGDDGRHWIITAYIARKLAEGEVEWARS